MIVLREKHVIPPKYIRRSTRQGVIQTIYCDITSHALNVIRLFSFKVASNKLQLLNFIILWIQN